MHQSDIINNDILLTMTLTDNKKKKKFIKYKERSFLLTTDRTFGHV